MPYHHSKQSYTKQRRSKRLLKFSMVVLSVVAVGALSILADNFFNRSQSIEIVNNDTQAKVRSASINIFRTPYFQFQADKSWREVTELDNPNKFVYRSYDANLVQNQFIVEVDDIEPIVLANENTTRVMPVNIEGNRLAIPFGVSDHCKTLLEEGSVKQARITFNEAEFPCVPDGSSFVAVVSQIGGNEFFEHIASDGKKHRYKLTFQDSTFSPNGRAMRGIIDSFQLL